MRVVPELPLTRTERGFAKGEFTDRYGAACSIQMSSLASEEAIWLGVDEPKVQTCRLGEGWKEVLLPADAHVFGRMHLTRPMVAALLPLLQRFVETGELG